MADGLRAKRGSYAILGNHDRMHFLPRLIEAPVVEAIRLSKATFRKIVQNLFWAWFYNLAAVPIAALGLLHPMIGVVAMTTSSLSVIANSLLLKRATLEVRKP